MSSPDILLFFGRFHPVLVHLPVGLIILLGIIELFARPLRSKITPSCVGFILALAVPAAAATAVCGWLLSRAGGYEPRLVQWHLWMGIGTAAGCALAGLLFLLNQRRWYRACLFSTLAALVVASHFGGSLTHGSDYLVRYAPNFLRAILGAAPQATTPAPKPADPLQQPAYAALVQPVLQENCISCHGPEKAKGKLRLDSWTALLKGGEAGPSIVAGKASESELVKRLRLPLDHEDHMPPEGKPQPAPDDLALLEWWINAGASAGQEIGKLNPPPNIQRILLARFGGPAPVGPSVAKIPPPKPLSQVLPLADQLADELAISITALSPQEPWLQCNASIAGTNFADADLARLAPLGTNLRWLDVAGTKVTDSGLASLAGMPNLTRLHLERTAITDAGLACLAGLNELEYLNLYRTEVSDAGLETLRKPAKLKQLYLWQTRVSPAALKSFAEARVDQEQVRRWREEIEQLKAKIQDQQIVVDLGVSTNSVSVTNTASATNSAPVKNAVALNSQCPVSGKPVDASKTAAYEDKLIAFCCDDCKAKFQQDPKPFLTKLGLIPAAAETTPKQTP